MTKPPPRIVVQPLTPARWNDFAALFGERGACGGCWCMLWRLPRQAFDAQKGAGNRAAMQALVAADEQPGLLAYRGKQAIGWLSLAPRVQFPALQRSRSQPPPQAHPPEPLHDLQFNAQQTANGACGRSTSPR